MTATIFNRQTFFPAVSGTSTPGPGARAGSPDGTLEQLKSLLGPLVPPLLRDERGRLDLTKIKAKDFEEFKSFLQTQVSLDQKSFNQYDLEIFGKKIGLSAYHKVLAKEEYRPLLQALYEASPKEGRDPAGKFRASELLERLTADLIGVSAETFVRQHLQNSSGRERLRRILGSPGHFDPDLRADLLKAIATIGQQEGIAGSHYEKLSDQISTWNYFNFAVTEEEIQRATFQAERILAEAERQEEDAARMEQELHGDPEKIATYRDNRERGDPLAQMRAKLTRLWLWVADPENDAIFLALGTEENRHYLAGRIEGLLKESQGVVSEQGFKNLNQKVQGLLNDPFPEEGPAFLTWLKHKAVGNGLEKCFAQIPARLKAPFEDFKQFSDELHYSVEMGERIRLEGPQDPAGETKLQGAVSPFIQGLEQLRRSLWYGYKQHKALSRFGSQVRQWGGEGDIVEIRRASRVIDGMIDQLERANSKQEVEAEVSKLYESLKSDGVLFRAMDAAQMDGIEQVIGLGQTVLVILATTVATEGLGTVAAVAKAVKGIAQVAARTAQTSALAARASYGLKMGAWISFAENSLAVATGEVRQGPDTLLSWGKDSLATGLAMGLFTPFAAQAGLLLERNVLQRLLARYFTPGVKGLGHFAGDTALEGMEEIVDAALRHKMDGRVGALGWDQLREIISVSTAGGGAKMGAVINGFRPGRLPSENFAAEPSVNSVPPFHPLETPGAEAPASVLEKVRRSYAGRLQKEAEQRIEFEREVARLEAAIAHPFDSPTTIRKFSDQLLQMDLDLHDFELLQGSHRERLTSLQEQFVKDVIPQISLADMNLLIPEEAPEDVDEHVNRSVFFGLIADHHPKSEISEMARVLINLPPARKESVTPERQMYQRFWEQGGLAIFTGLLEQGLKEKHFRNVQGLAEFLLGQTGPAQDPTVREFFQSHSHPLLRGFYYRQALSKLKPEERKVPLLNFWVGEYHRLQLGQTSLDSQIREATPVLSQFLDRALASEGRDLDLNLEGLEDRTIGSRPSRTFPGGATSLALGLGFAHFLDSPPAQAMAPGAHPITSPHGGTLWMALAASQLIFLAAVKGKKNKGKKAPAAEAAKGKLNRDIENFHEALGGVFDSPLPYLALADALGDLETQVQKSHPEDAELSAGVGELWGKLDRRLQRDLTLKDVKDLALLQGERQEEESQPHQKFWELLARDHPDLRVRYLAEVSGDLPGLVWPPELILVQEGKKYLLDVIDVIAANDYKELIFPHVRALTVYDRWKYDESLVRFLSHHPHPVVRGIYYQTVFEEVQWEHRLWVLPHLARQESSLNLENSRSKRPAIRRYAEQLSQYFEQVEASQGDDLRLPFEGIHLSSTPPPGGRGPSMGPLAALGFGLSTLLAAHPAQAMDSLAGETTSLLEPSLWADPGNWLRGGLSLGLLWGLHLFRKNRKLAELAQQAKENDQAFERFMKEFNPRSQLYKNHLREIAAVNPEAVFFLDSLRKKFPQDGDYSLMLRSLEVVYLAEQAPRNPRAYRALELLAYRDNIRAHAAGVGLQKNLGLGREAQDEETGALTKGRLGIFPGLEHFISGVKPSLGFAGLNWGHTKVALGIGLGLFGAYQLHRLYALLKLASLMEEAREDDKAMVQLKAMVRPDIPRHWHALAHAAQGNPEAVFLLDQWYRQDRRRKEIRGLLHDLPAAPLGRKAAKDAKSLEALLTLIEYENEGARETLREASLSSYRSGLTEDLALVHLLNRVSQESQNPQARELLKNLDTKNLESKIKENWLHLIILQKNAQHGDPLLRTRLQNLEVLPLWEAMKAGERSLFINQAVVPLSVLGNASASNLLHLLKPDTLYDPTDLRPTDFQAIAHMAEWNNVHALEFLALLAEHYPLAAYYLIQIAIHGNFLAQRMVTAIHPRTIHQYSHRDPENFMALVDLGHFGNKLANWAVKVHLREHPSDSHLVGEQGREGRGYRQVETLMSRLAEDILDLPTDFKRLEPEIQGDLTFETLMRWDELFEDERNDFFDEDQRHGLSGTLPVSFILSFLNQQGLARLTPEQLILEKKEAAAEEQEAELTSGVRQKVPKDKINRLRPKLKPPPKPKKDRKKK